MLTPRVKKVLMILAIVFVIYAIAISPTEAAGVVKSALSKLGAGLTSVGEFAKALMKK